MDFCRTDVNSPLEFKSNIPPNNISCTLIFRINHTVIFINFYRLTKLVSITFLPSCFSALLKKMSSAAKLFLVYLNMSACRYTFNTHCQRNNSVIDMENIDGLMVPIARSSKSQLWPILIIFLILIMYEYYLKMLF